MRNNNKNPKSFVNSFKSVAKNLATRYTINMHLDFINEFIKFADNTRDIELQNSILDVIQSAESSILTIITDYENQTNNKEDLN